MKLSQVEGDFAVAIQLQPKNAYTYYNRGNLFAAEKNYTRAIADYTHAISLDPNMAQAYYNRAVAHFHSGDIKSAQSDLSHAGELGLYNAYALSKKMSETQPKKKQSQAKK